MAIDFNLWAKWGDGGVNRYPLAAHLIDSALVAQTLVDYWLPQSLRVRLAELAGTSPHELRYLVAAAAGLHDLGKATPVFQGQLLGARVGEFHEHIQELQRRGYYVPSEELDGVSKTEKPFFARHEIVSGILVAKTAEDLDDFAAIITGHHGQWRLYDENIAFDCPAVEQYYQSLGGGEWAVQHGAHRELIEQLLEAPLPENWFHDDRSVTPLLTGLVSLADWLASGDESVSHGQKLVGDSTTEEFVQARRLWLDNYARDVLGEPNPPKKPFQEVFGFYPDRPAQRAMVQESEPGLTVVMVPMGEGKTEAALGRWMEGAQESQGLYFALPTMATADAMFERIQSFFSHSDDRTSATLAHGRAILNSFYSSPRDIKIYSEGDQQSTGLVPADWFTGRHRALLSPVTIGTVDQVLASALRHRYNYMRLIGLSTKTVVLDEVHSYDPYMAQLLCGFLQWAGKLAIDVVLLSATLPRRRLNEFVNAYRQGQGSGDVVDLSPPYPAIVKVESDVTVLDLSAEISRTSTVHLEYQSVKGSADDLIKVVEDIRRQHPTAKVGVMVNTVSQAQQVGAYFDNALVIHSRMTAATRAQRTEEVLDRFGKKAPAGPDMLVATQVAEQSLDIDLDVLVTELCPAAALLQRIGRVWRHDLDGLATERSRPADLNGPLCIVVYREPWPKNGMSLLPYANAEIQKTWKQALLEGKRTVVELPDDIQHMVDVADVSLGDIASDIQDVESFLAAESLVKGAARDVTIPTPASLKKRFGALADFSAGNIGDESTATRWDKAPSVTILPVSSTSPGAWVGNLPLKPNRGQLLDLLGCTIPVTGKYAATLLKSAKEQVGSIQSGVFEHRLLNNVLVVYLDDEASLLLDGKLGLLFK